MDLMGTTTYVLHMTHANGVLTNNRIFQKMYWLQPPRAGEDGSIRAWTTDRGKLCGTQTFSAYSTVEELDEAIEGSRRKSLDERMDTLEETGEAAKKKGDVPVPVCSLASCRAQPLVAVGLCHGAVHIVFVKEVKFRVSEPVLLRE